MLKATAVNHFGSQAAIAAVLGVSSAAVSKWVEVVPELQAYKLQVITRNKLRVDPSVYEKPIVA